MGAQDGTAQKVQAAQNKARRRHSAKRCKAKGKQLITGAIKNKVDAIWQKMWEGGITNPLEVISQLTYLMFIRSLDEKELEAERMEQALGTPQPRIFPQTYHNEYGAQIDGEQLRWSRFKDKPAQEMYRTVNEFVFPFIKQLGDSSAFSKAMENGVIGQKVCLISGVDAGQRPFFTKKFK